MRKYFFLNLLIAALFVYVYGCGDKKDDKTNNNKDGNVSELVKKDSISGKDKVQMKYVVKKGDKFYYKMVAKTSNMEKSPATEDKEVKQDNEINYYLKGAKSISPEFPRHLHTKYVTKYL